MAEPLHIRLLGGFRVSIGSRIIEDGEWRPRKAASLVKLLALSPDHRLHREQVQDLLWPHLDPAGAGNNLHQALHSARRVLDPARATAAPYRVPRNDQVLLCPAGALGIDVEAFEKAAETARSTRDPGVCETAAVLYTGDLLPEDRYRPSENLLDHRVASTHGARAVGVQNIV